MQDSRSTGRFLNHNYTLKTLVIQPDAGLKKSIDTILSNDRQFVIVNGGARQFRALVRQSTEKQRSRTRLLFNVGSANNGLRRTLCQSTVFHTLPSRAMLTDALVQFLVKRRWTRLMLVEGRRRGDRQLAASFRRSVAKFQVRLVREKKWLADVDIRRNASREVPRFTQGVTYDALIIADEEQDFGQYFLYNTWLPRPVGLSHGLRPVAWSRAVEQWGATQLQRRFQRRAKRNMTGLDYAAWAAFRSIGEAVTRLKSADPDKIAAFLRSDRFALAGFKGRKLSFRRWNGQLRQPIPLVHASAVVASAPIAGFLHRRTELDTLGFDENETICRK